MYGMNKSQIGNYKKMNNVKIVYDCDKKSTSFIPLSAAEIEQHKVMVDILAEQNATNTSETPAE